MTMVPNPDAARIRADLMAQFAPSGPRAEGPIPWPEFRSELLSLYEPPHRARATFIRMRHVLDLVGALGVASTADLTTSMVARFIEARPPAERPMTTKSLLATLRTACQYAATLGYVRVSPFALRKRWIRVAPIGDDRRRHHPIEDIARVLELGRQTIGRKAPGSHAEFVAWRTYALAATVAYTGLRRNEALWLWREDADIPHRVIRLVERSGAFKTTAAAVPVAMPDALAAILAGYLDYLARAGVPSGPVPAGAMVPARNPAGKREAHWLFPNAYRTGPWTGGSPGNKPLDRLKRLGLRAGVEGLTFLSLRHSWATHAESRWGFSAALIQRQLRHTTTKTQLHYRHADAANMRAAMEGIGFGGESAEAPEATPVPPLEFAPPAPARPADAPRPHRGPKLDDADVAEARELRARGWTYAQLQSRYGISKSTLSAMLNGLTHKHVPPAGEL